MALLKRDAIRARVQAYFKAQLNQYTEWLDKRGLTPNALEDARCEMLDHADYLESGVDTSNYLKVGRFRRLANISLEDWNDNRLVMRQELHKGRRDMLSAVLEAAERLEHYSYAVEPVTLFSPSAPASAPLGIAIDEFMNEHSRLWPEKAKNQIRAYFNILIEHFGTDRLLGAISKQDASDVKRLLLALPAGRNTKPALKNLPLSEVVKVEGQKTISPTTINNHIDMFRRFFDWAERHGHAPHKLFESMKVKRPRDAENERKPFSNDQTRLIFSELTTNSSGLVKKDSHKWSALLGLFTGARLNEICQLDVADIQRENDIWFLNITDEGDNNKRVKAKASRRKVPLHSELIRLGFIDFLESRKTGKRLFPDYSYSTNVGYGRNFGRWFNERFLPKLGIKEPGLVFHCLRHTMVTRLGQSGVAEPIYQCIVGHAREGVTQEVYLREGYTLEQMSEAIEKFRI